MASPAGRDVPADEGPRANEKIQSDEARVISAAGENLGVMPVGRAITIARDNGLDLVEVSPSANPPVCKILDLGKYKYEIQKKKNEAKKKQKTMTVKEVKFRPTIEEHDFDVKMRAIRRFLEGGDKVKVTLRFRGREMAHQDLGRDVLERIRQDTDDLARVDQRPRMEGRQMVMMLGPL